MNSKIAVTLFAALIWLSSHAARADMLSLKNYGLEIDGGTLGKLTLEYPQLADGSGGVEKILRKTVNGNTATIKYDSGATAAGKVPFYYGNSPQQYDCQTILVPGGDGKGYTIEAAIPWEAIGITPKVGAKFLFDIGIDDSTDASKGRQHQIMWNGTRENSRDRTHWGTVTLLE